MILSERLIYINSEIKKKLKKLKSFKFKFLLIKEKKK